MERHTREQELWGERAQAEEAVAAQLEQAHQQAEAMLVEARAHTEAATAQREQESDKAIDAAREATDALFRAEQAEEKQLEAAVNAETTASLATTLVSRMVVLRGIDRATSSVVSRGAGFMFRRAEIAAIATEQERVKAVEMRRLLRVEMAELARQESQREEENQMDNPEVLEAVRFIQQRRMSQAVELVNGGLKGLKPSSSRKALPSPRPSLNGLEPEDPEEDEEAESSSETSSDEVSVDPQPQQADEDDGLELLKKLREDIDAAKKSDGEDDPGSATPSEGSACSEHFRASHLAQITLERDMLKVRVEDLEGRLEEMQGVVLRGSIRDIERKSFAAEGADSAERVQQAELLAMEALHFFRRARTRTSSASSRYRTSSILDSIHESSSDSPVGRGRDDTGSMDAAEGLTLLASLREALDDLGTRGSGSEPTESSEDRREQT
mmetsp:Transcript_8008/g.17270  ORF Transcript_8008/g.17270 Transcript_8008/m.17270 type:complete len:442 (+) Transcript_8008:1-1326(+)